LHVKIKGGKKNGKTGASSRGNFQNVDLGDAHHQQEEKLPK